MNVRLSLLERIVRHRRSLNIATLVVIGLWAGWVAWITRPAALDALSRNAPWCTRATE
ncbi:hypothetical protein [Burkholderia sp. LMG 13014]|uniref:hypothetical protein n=1 Tax=Burkholderia sp. LMG 13014 TaxID=2709306 RepID=UPI001965E906|nr:hypothetical protein [Burkholderia sp. LMG 13014]